MPAEADGCPYVSSQMARASVSSTNVRDHLRVFPVQPRRCCSLDETPTRVNPEELKCWKLPEMGLCDGLLTSISRSAVFDFEADPREELNGRRHQRLGGRPVSPDDRRVPEVAREVSESESGQHDEIWWRAAMTRLGHACTADLPAAVPAHASGGRRLVVGIVGAYFFARLIRTQLYGVTPTDPMTFAVASLLLLFVAVVAAWLPARRAARIDPSLALRGHSAS